MTGVDGRPMRILIDTDPGQDDAVAILLALASPELEVAAVTAVAGNVPVAQTAANVRRVLDLAGSGTSASVDEPGGVREGVPKEASGDVPVFAGAAGPLVVPLETAEFVCGPDGLAGCELPPPSRDPWPEHAASAIIRLAAETGSPLMVCALGPLTNLALALRLAPGLPIGRILWMGGALGLGNMTPAAEFNAYVDPHALAVALDSGIPLTLFGLHVTHDAVPDAAHLARLADGGTCARAVHAWMTRPRPGRLGTAAHPWHDPCVIAGLLWPELFQFRDCHVSAATEPGPLRGRTTIDWHGRLGLPPNASVAGAIDRAAFFDRVVERLLTLP